MTVHFIDTDWKLHNMRIALVPVATHTAAAMQAAASRVFDDYGILDRVRLLFFLPSYLTILTSELAWRRFAQGRPTMPAPT